MNKCFFILSVFVFMICFFSCKNEGINNNQIVYPPMNTELKIDMESNELNIFPEIDYYELLGFSKKANIHKNSIIDIELTDIGRVKIIPITIDFNNIVDNIKKFNEDLYIYNFSMDEYLNVDMLSDRIVLYMLKKDGSYKKIFDNTGGFYDYKTKKEILEPITFGFRYLYSNSYDYDLKNSMVNTFYINFFTSYLNPKAASKIATGECTIGFTVINGEILVENISNISYDDFEGDNEY